MPVPKGLTVARILYGLVYLVFGANGFYTFIPVPEQAPEGEAFLRALIETGYMLPLWKGAEVLTGISFLTGLFMPLMLVVITPVLVNIVAFHVFLDPSPVGLATSAVLVTLHIYMTAKFWQQYAPIVKP